SRAGTRRASCARIAGHAHDRPRRGRRPRPARALHALGEPAPAAREPPPAGAGRGARRAGARAARPRGRPRAHRAPRGGPLGRGLSRVAARGRDPRRLRLRRPGARAPRLSGDRHARARVPARRRRAQGDRVHCRLLAGARARLVPPVRHAPPGAAPARAPRALMAETLGNLAVGFGVALSPPVLFYAFVGCVEGTLVGVLPGVGPLAGISLLLPATFGLDATRAIVMLAGIYYGAMYGGSTTSILMRIPGEAASVMTCIDGHPLARKGRGRAALAIAAVGSYVAGTVSVVALMLLAPPLAAFALRFGPPEYFALLTLGLLVLAYMSSGSMLKALAMAALGLLFGMIGIDQMTGYFRFAYGIVELGDGIGVVPVAVGLFGLAEILATAGQPTPTEIVKPRLRELLPSRQEWREAVTYSRRGNIAPDHTDLR